MPLKCKVFVAEDMTGKHGSNIEHLGDEVTAWLAQAGDVQIEGIHVRLAGTADAFMQTITILYSM